MTKCRMFLQGPLHIPLLSSPLLPFFSSPFRSLASDPETAVMMMTSPLSSISASVSCRKEKGGKAKEGKRIRQKSRESSRRILAVAPSCFPFPICPEERSPPSPSFRSHLLQYLPSPSFLKCPLSAVSCPRGRGFTKTAQ